MFARREDHRERAERAERALDASRKELAEVVASFRQAQQSSARDRDALMQRMRDLEQAADPKAREELATLRERETHLRERASSAEARVADAERRAADAALARQQADEARERLRSWASAAEDVVQAAGLLAREADALTRFGARSTLVPPPPEGAGSPEALHALAAGLRSAAKGHAELVASLARDRLGSPRRAWSDADALRAAAIAACEGGRYDEGATALVERARLWADDPKLLAYHVELLHPFVVALDALVRRMPEDESLAAGQVALDVVREAHRLASGHLLRRSAALDGARIEPTLQLDRYRQDAAHALARLDGLLAQARGLGPVDFFHNVAELARANLTRPGGARAAWLLSDVAAALLTDARVRAWMSDRA